MLNYIWLALISLGIVVALTIDISNHTGKKYRNNEMLRAEIITDSLFKEKSTSQSEAELQIKSNDFSKFYNVKIKPGEYLIHKVKLSFNKKENNYSFYMIVDDNSPEIWREMAKASGNEKDLTGNIYFKEITGTSSIRADIIFENISFARMKDVTSAIIEYAGKAVEIAIGLIGVMALWLGIMKIAEQAGLISIIAKAVKPITKFLFPDVPHDHPAIGSIIMNLSANMLGLGNAATPFGLKAMDELDKINPNKGTATNAMCTFLAINTAGVTLIPATAIAVRAASGSSEPAIIIGTAIFGSLCATIAGIFAAKTLEKFPVQFGVISRSIKKNFYRIFFTILLIAALIFLFYSGYIIKLFSFVNVEIVKTVIQSISYLAIPLIIILFVMYGIVKKVKIYEVFVEGAKEGFNVALKIIPYLVAMLVAIGIFRAGGAMDFLILILSPVTDLIGMPAEVMPMIIMKPLSGSGSLGIMSEIMSVHGPDSFIGVLVSTIMGSTETTFYVLALYFGSVNISKMRHAVAAGLIADIAGFLGALFIVRLLFG